MITNDTLRELMMNACMLGHWGIIIGRINLNKDNNNNKIKLLEIIEKGNFVKNLY